MQLQELTTYEVKSHLKIARVRFVIADHADPTKRKEWIEGQISTEIPIVRNGLRLRAEVLEQARDILDGLAADFQVSTNRLDRASCITDYPLRLLSLLGCGAGKVRVR